jgi:hypothetical protein
LFKLTIKRKFNNNNNNNNKPETKTVIEQSSLFSTSFFRFILIIINRNLFFEGFSELNYITMRKASTVIVKITILINYFLINVSSFEAIQLLAKNK